MKTYVITTNGRTIKAQVRFRSALGNEVLQLNYKELDPQAKSKEEVRARLTEVMGVTDEEWSLRTGVDATPKQQRLWHGGIVELDNDSEHDYILVDWVAPEGAIMRYFNGGEIAPYEINIEYGEVATNHPEDGWYMNEILAEYKAEIGFYDYGDVEILIENDYGGYDSAIAGKREDGSYLPYAWEDDEELVDEKLSLEDAVQSLLAEIGLQV